MTLTKFRASNHPQQSRRWGASDAVADRATHPRQFAAWDERFGGFTVDVAASRNNAKVSRFFTREDDGLAQSWAGERVWCNPPFSDIGPWVAKAWAEHPTSRGIVMILPANRTEQGWWQQLVEPFRDRGGVSTIDRVSSGAPEVPSAGSGRDRPESATTVRVLPADLGRTVRGR